MVNPYTVELYHLDVTGSTFEKLDEIEGYNRLEFDRKLDSYGTCVVQLDVRHKKATAENCIRWVNHIAIKKGDTIVWAGPMTKLKPSIGVGVAGLLTVEAREHQYHLRRRFTDALLRFTDTDTGDIAWELIDHVQSRDNGELMIREGAIVATTDRDRTYERGQVLQKIIELSQIRAGIDFSFDYQQDANKELEQINFNAFARKGAFRPNLPKLQLGTTVNKVKAITTGDMANTVTVLGAGTGSTVPASTDEDTSVQAAFTRREDILKAPDVSVQTTLDDKAEKFLDNNKLEQFSVQVQLESSPQLSYGTFEVGDQLEVDLVVNNALGEPTLINFQGKTRVLEINVEIDKSGGEIVTPTISSIT